MILSEILSHDASALIPQRGSTIKLPNVCIVRNRNLSCYQLLLVTTASIPEQTVRVYIYLDLCTSNRHCVYAGVGQIQTG